MEMRMFLELRHVNDGGEPISRQIELPEVLSHVIFSGLFVHYPSGSDGTRRCLGSYIQHAPRISEAEFLKMDVSDSHFSISMTPVIDEMRRFVNRSR